MAEPLPATRIFIDADACPVKDEVFKVAARYQLHVFVVANQWINVPLSPAIEMRVVTGGFDAADDWIVEHARARDIVITADILLAERCRGAVGNDDGARVRQRNFKPFQAESCSVNCNSHSTIACAVLPPWSFAVRHWQR